MLKLLQKGGSINIKPENKGKLHDMLNVPRSEHIPSYKLRIKESDSDLLKKRKQFAINAKKFKHK